MRNVCLLLLLFFSVSCHNDQPEGSMNVFSDDFEDYATVDDMIGTTDRHWTEVNINEEINTSTNPIALDTTVVHSGNQSVRFHCKQDDPAMTEVCKCNLNKGNLYFRNGDVMYYSAWYYVERSDSAYGTFFVWDLEELVHGSTGIRIMAWEGNLELERNKMGLPNLFQEEPVTLFPVNRWTHVELEVRLSQYRKGSVRMWLDGQELINRHNIITLPRDVANLGWDTKGYYDRLQVGITAKNGTSELVLYVDDVEIRKK